MFTIFSLLFLQTSLFTPVTTGPVVTNGGDSRSVNWFDFDRDSDLDLFISNGKKDGENNFFYLNNGDGTFTAIDTLAINKDGSPSVGATAGDFNNDGFPDLFVSTWYGLKNYLYLNDQGKRFIEVSESPVMKDLSYAETGSFGDYDRDGWLDLFVTISAGNTRNFLYRNDGSGKFTKLAQTGFLNHRFSSRTADFVDINSDTYPDIFVTNEYGQAENLYLGSAAGSFSSAAPTSISGLAGNTTSASWEDLDNDGDFDLILTNYGNEKNHLLFNKGNLQFEKSGFTPWSSDVSNSFSSATGDVDNDGDLDVLITNAFSASGGKLVNFFYLNDGSGQFSDASHLLPADSGWVYGASFADYDGDGHLDLALAACFGESENNRLYRNNGNGNNWIQFDLEGVKSNRSGIGAILHIYSSSNGKMLHQTRRMSGQSGYGSQTLRIHAGLGTSEVADSVVILWASGIRQKLENVPSNQLYPVKEDTLAAVSVKEEPVTPNLFKLHGSYPNPFNPAATITYSISEPLKTGKLEFTIFDITGKQVDSFSPPETSPGTYKLTLQSAGWSSGHYLVRLSDGLRSDSILITLVK
ncbi:MAG: VCBS repeat-containing protein [Bacteroidetes bacterium]|nr:VCBS repeat-containing protein [Bacteroidota bacterium]